MLHRPGGRRRSCLRHRRRAWRGIGSAGPVKCKQASGVCQPAFWLGNGAAQLTRRLDPLLSDLFYGGESFPMGLPVSGAARQLGDLRDERLVFVALRDEKTCPDLPARNCQLSPSSVCETGGFRGFVAPCDSSRSIPWAWVASLLSSMFFSWLTGCICTPSCISGRNPSGNGSLMGLAK